MPIVKTQLDKTCPSVSIYSPAPQVLMLNRMLLLNLLKNVLR